MEETLQALDLAFAAPLQGLAKWMEAFESAAEIICSQVLVSTASSSSDEAFQLQLILLVAKAACSAAFR